MRSCSGAAKKMEDILFFVGSTDRIIATLRYFRERSSLHELDTVMVMGDGDKSNKYYSKEGKLQSIVMDGLEDFLGMLQYPRGEGYKGGCRRLLENQNAYDAIMAAINSNEMTNAKLGRMLNFTLNVSHCQIKRGRALHKDMENMDKKSWIRRPSAVPKNAIKEGKIQNESDPFLIILFLHS